MALVKKVRILRLTPNIRRYEVNPLPEHDLRMLARAAFKVERELKPKYPDPAYFRADRNLTFVAYENRPIYSEEKRRNDRIVHGFDPDSGETIC